MNNKANLASRDERSLPQVIGMSEGSEQVLKATMSLSGMGKSAQSQDSHSLGQLCELGTANKTAEAASVCYRRSMVLNLFIDPALQD